jgi:transcription initiation factor TFIIB
MQTSVTCSSCNNNTGQIITDSESGEIICRNCGMVMLDNVQESRPEWRSFTTDEVNNSRSRTGMPTSLARHDKGLATIIGRANKDASGQVLDAAMRSTMERLRTWDFRRDTLITNKKWDSNFNLKAKKNLQQNWL